VGRKLSLSPEVCVFADLERQPEGNNSKRWWLGWEVYVIISAALLSGGGIIIFVLRVFTTLWSTCTLRTTAEQPGYYSLMQ